jgi:hypothetical protein
MVFVTSVCRTAERAQQSTAERGKLRPNCTTKQLNQTTTQLIAQQIERRTTNDDDITRIARNYG